MKFMTWNGISNYLDIRTNHLVGGGGELRAVRSVRERAVSSVSVTRDKEIYMQPQPSSSGSSTHVYTGTVYCGGVQ